MANHEPLTSLITPALLAQIAEGFLPFSKTEQLNFSDVESKETQEHFKDVCKSSNAKRALIALSQLSPDATLPDLDLMSLLPVPTAKDFPQQCFGLQLLFDQASRILFPGIDARWQSGYFGPLGRQLAGQWYAFPEEQRPYKWRRWQDMGVTSFSYWVATQTMWAAPFLHAEDLKSQQIGLDLSEELRQAVEHHTGKKDSYRETRDVTLKDDLAFLREVVKGSPVDEGESSISLTNWAFWWCMILDAHWPIIKRFGRYPYRNAILGRVSTEEEKEWLDDTGHFGEASPEVAEKIRKDVEKGQWTPLGQE
ncbi:uncharacterized protein B0J16DRAFT_179639 [Fusarium flagelliforme]|uniref:Uncharacterized protein n=1 Tax=Fusarium flagelliforme TaxID=2675880 RepID=A0A395M5M1_9HYPO|nr:uncharacterized protein B0J16DRAFT_179639 [Fusarium flagelliforme]KAH7180025.1 hypothetical protein B0J16DRAFT_179639 [Fusarium flagelliforme]RFN43157.1 hypothetical protein FIE12Z_12608 [Fusarium flagelliforme]